MRILNQEVRLESDRDPGLAGSHARQPLGGQFAADSRHQRDRDQRGVYQGLGQRDIAALLGQQHKILLAHAQPAVRLGHRDAGQPELGELAPERVIAAAVRLPARADPLGGHLVDQEIVHRFPEQQLIFVKREIH